MGKKRKTPDDLLVANAVPLPAWIDSPYSDGEDEEGRDRDGKEAPRLPGRPRGTTKLQCSWDKAIIALLTIPTVEEAARSIGVSKATLYLWMNNPKFNAQLQEIRKHGMLQAILSIYGSMGKTMQVLMDIRDDPKQPGAVRVSASKELIALWTKFYDAERSEELAGEKIKALEKLLAEITNHETHVGDGQDDSERAGPPALTDGSGESGTDQGAGAANAGAPGAGEGQTDQCL